MFSLMKQVLIVLLSFSSSLATKCLSLNDEPCMGRPIVIDWNPVELKYYPFMISLDKCSEICNALSSKTWVPKKTKDVNVKAFDMITNKNEAKTMAKHFLCGFKCKFNSTACNSNQKCNNKTCPCEYKNYRKCKKSYSCNPSTCTCDNSKFLKIIIQKMIQKMHVMKLYLLWILYQEK